MTITSFFDFAGRGGGGGALLTITGTDLRDSFLELLLGEGTRRVNFDEIFALRVLVFLLVNSASHLEAYTADMKFQMESPIPSKSSRSFTLFLSTCLPWIYLAKILSETLTFLASDARCSIEPCREMGWKDPLHNSGLVGAWGSYGSWMLMMSSSWIPFLGVASLFPPVGLVLISKSVALPNLNALSCSVSYDNSGLLVFAAPATGVSSRSISMRSQYGVERPEDTIEGSLEERLDEVAFLPRTSLLLDKTCPVLLSIPMLDSEGIAGKGLLRKESVVELLRFEKEKDNLFADFPIGATIQDGGKRKRSAVRHYLILHQEKRKDTGKIK